MLNRRLIAPLLAGLVTLLAMLALSGLVYAQAGATAPEENLVQRLTTMIFQILTPVITIFAMWAAHRGIALLEKKLDFDVPDQQEAFVDKWIGEAILWAEEKSRSKLKQVGKRLTGPEKLENAGSHVLDLIESKGWVGWTRDRVNRKLEAKLGMHRANGGKPTLDKDEKPEPPPPIKAA